MGYKLSKIYVGTNQVRPAWWDFSNWTLAQTSNSLSWTWWGWVYFNPDWTKIYLTCDGWTNSQRIIENTLSTPYDISTITYTKYISWWNCEDIHFSTDGTKMFIYNPSNIRRWTLSTAWDISTATQDQSLNVWDWRWLFFTSDGKTMFYSHHSNNTTQKRTLTTAWDLTTAGSATTVSSTYWWLSIWFSPDGKTFVCQRNESTTDLTWLKLSTPYDLSTATETWTQNIWSCRAWWLWFSNNWHMCVMVWGGSGTNYVTKYTL